MAIPKLKTLTVSYALGVKANLGNFESGDIRLSREETWEIPDSYAVSDSNALFEARRTAMKAELDELVQSEYKEMLGKK